MNTLSKASNTHTQYIKDFLATFPLKFNFFVFVTSLKTKAIFSIINVTDFWTRMQVKIEKMCKLLIIKTVYTFLGKIKKIQDGTICKNKLQNLKVFYRVQRAVLLCKLISKRLVLIQYTITYFQYRSFDKIFVKIMLFNVSISVTNLFS